MNTRTTQTTRISPTSRPFRALPTRETPEEMAKRRKQLYHYRSLALARDDKLTASHHETEIRAVEARLASMSLNLAQVRTHAEVRRDVRAGRRDDANGIGKARPIFLGF